MQDEQKSTKSQNVEQLRKAIQQINILNSVVQSQQEHIKMQQAEFSSMSDRIQNLESKLESVALKLNEICRKMQQQQEYSGSRFEQEMGEQVLTMTGKVEQNQNAYARMMQQYSSMKNLPEAYQDTFK